MTAFLWGTQTPNFFARGIQKSVLLAEYLKLPVSILEDISSPKIEHSLGRENLICKRQSHLLPSHQLMKLCTCRKTIFFFNWKKELSNDASNLISNFGGLHFDDQWEFWKKFNNKNWNDFYADRLIRLSRKTYPAKTWLEQITLNDIEIDNL